MEAKKRKYCAKLIYSGKAFIAFGIWGIVRMFLLKVLDPLSLQFLIGQQDGVSQELFDFIMLVLIFAVMGMDLLLRLYIGRNAIKEGQGSKRRLVYVIVAALYLCFTVGSDAMYLLGLTDREFTVSYVTSTLIDLTACVSLAEIVFSSLALRRMNDVEVRPEEVK